MKTYKIITAAFAAAAMCCFAQETEEIAEITEVIEEEVQEVFGEEVQEVAKVQEVTEVQEEIAEDVADEIAEEDEALEMEDDSPRVSVAFSIDVATGNISDDGFKLSKDLVLNPGLEITAGLCDGISVIAGVWANYDLDRGKKNGADKNRCLTEVDIWAGLSIEITDNLTFDGSFVSWQYHNTPECTTDNLFAFDLNYARGGFEAGVELEYMVSGESKKDIALRPYLKYSIGLCEKIDVGLELGAKPSFVIQDEGDNAWTAYILSAKLNVGPVYGFAKYYGLMQKEKIYTREMYDDVNTVFGIGYKVEF